MALTAIPIIASAIYFFHYDPDRIGLRAYEVAPFVIPFAVALAYRGSHLAVLLIGMTIGFLAITQSRTPIAAGAVTFAISFIWLSPRALSSVRLGAGLVVLAVLVSSVSLQFEPVKIAAANTVSRLTGEEIYIDGTELRPEFDRVRENLTELAIERIEDYNPVGIGYENFMLLPGNIYDEVLHSTYETWVIEMGVVGTLIALFMLAEFFRVSRRGLFLGDDDDRALFKCIVSGIVGALVLAFFHQPHQSPGFWMMIGFAFGAHRRVVTP
jgi:hypothetical protein